MRGRWSLLQFLKRRRQLAQRQYPVSIRRPACTRETRTVSGIKISRRDVIQISTQIAMMLETGVTLIEALDCIAKQIERNPKLKSLVEDLSVQVQGGSDFSAALTRHPRSFPRLYVALIKASEKSGMMSKLLSAPTTYMRDEQETLRRVKALTYPAIMLAFAITTTIFLLAFVLPHFTVIYASAKRGVADAGRSYSHGRQQCRRRTHWSLLLLSVLGRFVGRDTFFFRCEARPRGRATWHFTSSFAPADGFDVPQACTFRAACA